MTPILPTVNATLNATAAVLLVWGYWLIRHKRIETHRKVMTTAFVTSCLFLVCYLVYHAQVGSVRFPKTGTIRTVYLSILGTHTVLAAAVPFLAIITLRRGLAAKYAGNGADLGIEQGRNYVAQVMRSNLNIAVAGDQNVVRGFLRQTMEAVVLRVRPRRVSGNHDPGWDVGIARADFPDYG